MGKSKNDQRRLNYTESGNECITLFYKLEKYIQKTTLEPLLVELVKLRCSQINGCAYCIDMHTKDARSHGETEQRLYGVTAWRETPFYTERERAALLWAESVTLISKDHVPDEIYDQVKVHFTEKELLDLTFVVIGINSWNRLAISFRSPPGSYQPDHPITKK